MKYIVEIEECERRIVTVRRRTVEIEAETEDEAFWKAHATAKGDIANIFVHKNKKT